MGLASVPGRSHGGEDPCGWDRLSGRVNPTRRGRDTERGGGQKEGPISVSGRPAPSTVPAAHWVLRTHLLTNEAAEGLLHPNLY